MSVKYFLSFFIFVVSFLFIVTDVNAATGRDGATGGIFFVEGINGVVGWAQNNDGGVISVDLYITKRRENVSKFVCSSLDIIANKTFPATFEGYDKVKSKNGFIFTFVNDCITNLPDGDYDVYLTLESNLFSTDIFQFSVVTDSISNTRLWAHYLGILVNNHTDNYDSYPTVMKDGDKYKMWFTGVNTYRGEGDAIFYTESTNGIDWQFVEGNQGGGAVLTITNNSCSCSNFGEEPSCPGGGQDFAIDDMHVADPSVVKVNGTYYMYYTAASKKYSCYGSNNHIALATSTDGINWQKASNTVIAPKFPCVDYKTCGPWVAGYPFWYGAGIPSVIYYDFDDDGNKEFMNFYTDGSVHAYAMTLAVADHISGDKFEIAQDNIVGDSTYDFKFNNYLQKYIMFGAIPTAVDQPGIILLGLANKYTRNPSAQASLSWDFINIKTAIPNFQGDITPRKAVFTMDQFTNDKDHWVINNGAFLGNPEGVIDSRNTVMYMGAGKGMQPLHPTWDIVGIDMWTSKLSQVDYDGYVDTPKPTATIRGWAKDLKDANRAVVIKFYKDKNPFDGGDYLGKVTADTASTDVGAHRFEWQIPSQYLKNDTKIYAYATDKNEVPIFELKNSPATVQATDKIPYGYLDRITADGKVFGWAKDDDTTGAIKVHFYKNGPAGSGTYIGETIANVASADVGTHRFEWQIPTQYLESSFRVYVHAINYPQNNLLNVKINNSPQIYIPDRSKQVLNDTLYIAPIWHRLDRPYSVTDNFWQNMKTRLGGDKPYIKTGMTAYAQYTTHTTGVPNYDYIADQGYTDPNAAPEHKNDSLGRYYSMAKQYNYDVVLNMSGSPWNEWFDCSCPTASIYGCSSKSNNILTYLEEKNINVQWDQNNNTYNDSCTNLPPLQRNVTFNIYNKDVAYYMEKNIKQATLAVLNDPGKKSITKAFSIDADAFFTVWGVDENTIFDYNPDSLQQFRDYLFCKGEYSATGNFAFLKPKNCFKDLVELNVTLNTNFKNYVVVSPPRQVSEGFKDNNNKLWQKWLEFRQHMVFVNNYLKMLWVSEAGVPANMVYGHIGMPVNTPALGAIASTQYLNNMASSLETGGVYPFGNGTNLYGNEAKNSDNNFFQKIKNTNSNWGVFETNAVSLNLTKPETFNEYYKTLQQAVLHGARFLSPLAWHVGYNDGGEQNLGATKVRDTAYEDAIREFVNIYGNYPVTDMVWEFGAKTLKCVDKTGVTTTEKGSCNQSSTFDRTQLEGWTPSGYNNSKLENGVVSLVVNNSDPHFISPSNLSYTGKSTDSITLIIKVSGNSEQIPGQIFFQTENQKFWDQPKSTPFVIYADNSWHRYVIKVGLNSNWVNNKVYQVRVDVGNNSANKNVDIDLVWISKKADLSYDLNFDKAVNISDLQFGAVNLFNKASSQITPKAIKLETVVNVLKYAK